MNLTRSLSNYQLYYLRQVCEGKMVIVYCEDHQGYCEPSPYGCSSYSQSKPHGRHLLMSTGHQSSSITELMQRKVLIDINGRLMPNKDAAKQFGSPSAIPKDIPAVKMSRTRAARNQDSE